MKSKKKFKTPEVWARRVDSGARFLEKYCVELWWKSIDVSRLDLQQGCYCIIGQIYPGKYFWGSINDLWRGMGGNGKPEKWAVSRGFTVPEKYVEDKDEAWAALTELWLKKSTSESIKYEARQRNVTK